MRWRGSSVFSALAPEIRELAEIYNRGIISVGAAGESLRFAYLQFVRSLARALDARDPCTAGHGWRVSQLSCAVAESLQLPDEHVERIRIGALLHDIGKLGISDRILQKPGELTDEEYELIREHPMIGRSILEAVQGFGPCLAAVELHHENWDGTGYPRGQAGEATPIDARIVHVADAYDAITTDRSYRRGISRDEALSILRAGAGKQFDPQIVDVIAELARRQVRKPAPPMQLAIFGTIAEAEIG